MAAVGRTTARRPSPQRREVIEPGELGAGRAVAQAHTGATHHSTYHGQAHVMRMSERLRAAELAGSDGGDELEVLPPGERPARRGDPRPLGQPNEPRLERQESGVDLDTAPSSRDVQGVTPEPVRDVGGAPQ